MRYLSLCSGIEAATVAWSPLGWSAAAFSEIEPFPCSVLSHHYPDVPNLGDMTKITKEQLDEHGPVQLIVGGSPCQSFSVAGLRKGMDDPRGNLALIFLGIVDAARPRWMVFENVPGLLSSGNGRDFGSFLGALGELGYGWAYRVIDAQYVRVDGHERAVPQRRRRVFVVGYLGDWRRAAAVLFERESVSWHTPPRRETRSSVAALTATGVGTCGADDNQAQSGHLVGVTNFGEQDVSTALTANGQRLDTETMVTHTLRGEGHDAGEDGTGRGVPIVVQERMESLNPNAGPNGKGWSDSGAAFTLESRHRPQTIAFDTTQVTSAANRSNPKPGDPCHTLAAGAHPPAVAFDWQSGGDARGLDPKEVAQLQACQVPAIAIGVDIYNQQLTGDVGHTMNTGDVGHTQTVRRILPVEAERLQGFPDGYTDVPHRGKPAADGNRYKALGNSMAVNAMRWIGRRIQMVEALPSPSTKA